MRLRRGSIQIEAMINNFRIASRLKTLKGVRLGSVTGAHHTNSGGVAFADFLLMKAHICHTGRLNLSCKGAPSIGSVDQNADGLCPQFVV